MASDMLLPHGTVPSGLRREVCGLRGGRAALSIRPAVPEGEGGRPGVTGPAAALHRVFRLRPRNEYCPSTPIHSTIGIAVYAWSSW